jgi:hypothetical protein
MMDTYIVQKAAYDEYWTCMASDEEWYPEDWPKASGENGANDDDVDYSPREWCAYWLTNPENPPDEQRILPMNSASRAPS